MNILKQILATVGFSITHLCSYGQVPQELYDDINLGPTGIPSLVGQVGDWGSTHGSPTYSPTDFYMWYNRNLDIGEGIFRQFNFMPNTDYYITVGITRSNSTVNDNQNGFKVLLANNVVADGVAGWGGPIPSFSSSWLLFNYIGADFTFKTLSLKFRTSNQGYNNIVFYPVTATAGAECYLVIDCITILSCPIGDTYYYNTTIPSGITNSNNVYIGSSFGSAASLTSSDPNAITEIFSTQKIELTQNTDLSANGSNIVSLEITDPCYPLFPWNLPVGTIQSEFRENACGITRPANEGNNNLLDLKNDLHRKGESESEIFISPNPTEGKLNISFLRKLNNAEITVSSIDGKAISKHKVVGKQSADIDISFAPTGIYFIKIVDGNFTGIKKVIKK